jgi:spore maturation protein A
MMRWVFGGLLLISIVAALLSGNSKALSDAVLAESAAAVTLCISLIGMICLWSGLMRVAQESGLTTLLSKALSPIMKFLFKGIDPNGKAMQMILLNLTANLLGLANASTPFGLEAMKALREEEQTGDTASDNMIVFVVMNTASLQIIPATIAALRQKHGSQSPMEILPLVWVVSFVSVTVAVTVAKTFAAARKKKKRARNQAFRVSATIKGGVK